MIGRIAGSMRATTTAPGRVPGRLGAVPEVAVIAALGLILCALSMTSLRLGGPLPELVANLTFWLSLLLITLPAAARLLDAGAPRLERLGLLLLVAEALYLVKLIRDPTAFTRYDELLHWRTAVDIASTERLFNDNPLLVVSPLFPGLESNVALLMQLSGADAFTAGIIVIGVARAVLALGLFLLFERVGGSAWGAGIATALYMANPSFIFFSSIFVYESLALAIAVIVLLLTIRRFEATGRQLHGATIALLLALSGLVITHHVTTLATIGILALFSAVAYIARRQPMALRASQATVVLAAMTLAWLVFVASPTFRYLGPPVINAAGQLVGLLTGQDVVRPLFTAESGEVAPLWERIAGLAGTAIILGGIAIGIPLLWMRRRDSLAAVALGVLAAAYPALLIVRATRAGASLASRSSSFIFLGVALVVAIAIVWMLSVRGIRISQTTRRLGMVGLAGLLTVGSVTVGTPSWQRLPGPYLPGADSRSMSPEGEAMAAWALEALGPDNRFAGDRTSRLLLGSYGDQHVVFAHGGGTATWAAFVTDELGPTEFRVMRTAGLEFIVIDRRLSQAAPPIGYYYERAETFRRRRIDPMPPGQLDNYDEVGAFSRLYDNGPVQVYDVRELP